MNVLDFLITPEQACRRTGPYDKIVFSSRVRLARNLRGIPFPSHARKADRVKAAEIITPSIQSLAAMSTDPFVGAMDQIPNLDKQILVERHLISREHAARGAGSALVLNREESLSVMINEEDHLRMQALRPGLQLKQAWLTIDGVDSELESKLDIAFSDEFGYLTACPTNLGTGIRVSAMLHLPGLVHSDQINQIVQAVSKLGLAVRGLYGEGTEALGNIFQVSNQMTLGESESEIVERINKVLLQIIENEENARINLLDQKPAEIFNLIGRAYGILAHAHTIASKETMNLLSWLRLGVDLGMFPGIEKSFVDELFLISQPAHLQLNHAEREKLTAEQRDLSRADLLRHRLKSVPTPDHLRAPRRLDNPEA